MPAKATLTDPQGAYPNSFKYSPLEYVRTLYVRFIQGLFAASPTGAYHWDTNPDVSEIIITDENPVKADKIGYRPAVTITRGPIQFFSLGFDDLLNYDYQTGKKTKSVLIPGTISINCCARVDLEADRIAFIIAEELWLNRDLLQKMGFFDVGRKPTIGAPTPAGSIIAGDNGDEWYATTITCPYQLYRTGTVTPLGENILREISLEMRGQLLPAPGSCGVPATANGTYPFSVQGCPPPSFAPDASDVNGFSPNPGYAAPQLPVVPHPLNPAQMVVVRAVRPNCPAVKPPSIRGMTIPISTTVVEESCGKQMSTHVTDSSTVKV